jgi:cation diffusion facilitator CzcD-associated flavoprotein CzcO
MVGSPAPSPTPSAALPVAVVGAGPAGLAMARALRVRGLPYVQFERHRDLGGIWDIDNPGTPMYESAHFISSRDKSGFYDFPMPESYADYPSRTEILQYTHSFADAFGLRAGISFGTSVLGSRQAEDGSWTVDTSAGEVRASALVCCTGVTWDPRTPDVSGHFAGEIIHSVQYRDPSLFAGKRVLIVGLGNSGADIACDAAPAADAAFISTRRGYHFVPKFFAGKPSDQTEWLPIWGERLLYSVMRPLVIGDVRRWGLPRPDHRLFETHPLLNTQLLHYLQHGDLAARPGVLRFDGRDVVFTDGTRERIDLVVFATGYDMSIPYVPHDYLSWTDGRPNMYLNAFATRPGLFGVSYLEVNSSAYTLFDRIANLVAQHLADHRDNPVQVARFRELMTHDHPDLSSGVRFVDSPRHTNYVEVRAFKRALSRVAGLMGWAELRPGRFDAIRMVDARV